MASKSFLTPFVRHATTRGYAQAAPAAKRDSKLTSTLMPHKTFVAAFDNGSPVTRVTVAFKAGSRYEPQTELGTAHVIRSSAGLSTKHANNFIMSRKMAQYGASVTASGDREFIYYTLEATQDTLSAALDILSNMITCQEFRPWELTDNEPRLKFEIAALPPQVRAVDLMHKAAFRRNLGNSLFISPRKIGKISSESLQHFTASNMTPDRCAIVVVGAPQERANMIAQNLNIQASTSSPSEPSKYIGGELRKEMGGDLAHIAIATQGAAAGTPQALALAIAAKALGNGPVTKWGSDNSPLAKAIGNVGPFAAAGFNVTYSDNGLFGVVLSVPKDEASAAVKAVGGVLRNPKLSNEAIQAGKSQLKLQILSEADEGSSLAESIAAQGLYKGQAKSPADIAREIDAVSTNDVASALSSVAKNKLSMGAVGNLAFVPYVDEL
ncbi:unnamed protein product [Chrysodeixis includens]|uniref:Cytochrome b-c1 complex subunit 2, mitochondrial n=1 Tax=Chrysodeixis includens TaxID=689277 RepID=A0A9P0FU78_CHRIL|nr:unnamed protein product [Chrysodeixis includens]